jgi:hypothetical protein
MTVSGCFLTTVRAEPPIGFNYKRQGFFEVATRFGQGSTLSVYARNFSNVADVPISVLFDDLRKLRLHSHHFSNFGTKKRRQDAGATDRAQIKG